MDQPACYFLNPVQHFHHMLGIAMKNMSDKKMILGFVLLCTGVVVPWSFAHGMKIRQNRNSQSDSSLNWPPSQHAQSSSANYCRQYHAYKRLYTFDNNIQYKHISAFVCTQSFSLESAQSYVWKKMRQSWSLTLFSFWCWNQENHSNHHLKCECLQAVGGPPLQRSLPAQSCSPVSFLGWGMPFEFQKRFYAPWNSGADVWPIS